MNRRTARGNRIGLAVVGLLLLLAGAAALARGLSIAPGLLGRADAPILEQRVRDLAAGQAWFWVVIAVLLLLVTLLALRWLAVQARTDTLRTLRLESDARRGTVRMPAGAATGAIDDDLAGSPYVRRVQATLHGSSARPRQRLSVTMTPTAEPTAVLDRVYQAVDRNRQALETPGMPTLVRLRVARG